MGTKQQLLALFESNKGTYFSGEDISKKLSVSRTAVWKAVKSLRVDGYKIDAVQNKGYCLSIENDILSVEGIKKYLYPVCSDLKIEVFQYLTSTNTAAREKAAAGMPEGYTAVANEQTIGRGRSGNDFFSPADTGIYMSVILRPPHCSSKQAVRLTTMAAVAVCEAVEAVSGKKSQIKWVNDIFISGKKVCGILTEASFSLEDGFLEYAVLGIGINVYPPKGGFPNELQNIAGAVFSESRSDGKNRLAAEILNRFMGYYKAQNANYTDKYRDLSLVIGKEIQVISSDGFKKAVALDIDDDCHLIVKYDDGKSEALSSGEIKIKLS